MRIAVLSDVHGNLAALEAVLDDVRRSDVDLIVNLGDCLSGPLQPAETADLLISLELPTVAGNHERQLLTQAPERMGESDAYAASVMTSDHWAWLRDLPATMSLFDGEILLCHGTPDSDLAYFLETVEPGGVREATNEEVEERAGSARASLILCGHTHIPRTRQLSNGRTVVNPGSVGLPGYEDFYPFPHKVQIGTPHARYAVAEPAGKGAWSVVFRQIDYDWEEASRVAASRGRSDWATALRSGRL
jgi:putative phosphoesterase